VQPPGRRERRNLDMRDLASAMRKLRTELGYTQTKMAELLHLSLSGYVNYESGSRTPSADTLQALVHLVEDHNLDTRVFETALKLVLDGSSGPVTAEERAWCTGLLYLLRNKQLRTNPPQNTSVEQDIVFLLSELVKKSKPVQQIGDQNISQLLLDLKVLSTTTEFGTLKILLDEYMRDPNTPPLQAIGAVETHRPSLMPRLAKFLAKESRPPKSSGKRRQKRAHS